MDILQDELIVTIEDIIKQWFISGRVRAFAITEHLHVGLTIV